MSNHEIYPESRELLTLIFEMQAYLVSGGETPIITEHFISMEQQRALEVQNQVIGIMAVMLTDIATMAGIDLSASWAHTIQEALLEEDDDEPGC